MKDKEIEVKQRNAIKYDSNVIVSICRMSLPEREEEKHLTLTAADTQRCQTEAAIFGRVHFLTGTGGCFIFTSSEGHTKVKHKTETLYIFNLFICTEK